MLVTNPGGPPASNGPAPSTAELQSEFLRITAELLKHPGGISAVQAVIEQIRIRGAAGQPVTLDAPARRPFGAGLIEASAIPASTPPPRLWFGLYRSSVTLLIGETGAGKSSLLYNIAVHAARNEALWGISFCGPRPLRVLYVDPENSGSWEEKQGGLCARKLDRIATGRPPGLFFHDGRCVNLADPAYLSELTQVVREHRIELVILDPIANLFNTKDENDNAEAARQMRMLTDLSRQTGACVLCCHHTGKDSFGNYGRGASARLAAADVGIVLRARGNQDDEDDDFRGEMRERTDVCRLQVVKNRLDGRASLFLKMAGEDRFERVEFAHWRQAKGAASGRKSPNAQAEEEIGLLLQHGNPQIRVDIVQAMEKEGLSRNAVDSALKSLADKGLVKVQTGPHNTKLYLWADEEDGEEIISFPVSPTPIENGETGKLDLDP